MKTQKIEFDNGEVKARIVVSEANALQGIKRTRLAYEAGQSDDPDLRIMHGFYYPALIAAAQSVTIDDALGDPSFDEFCRLPETLVKQWEDATFTLNAHWLPSEDDQKKESN